MEEGRINGNELKTELKEIHTQIIKLQKKRMPPKRTSTSETPAITLDAIRQLTADFTLKMGNYKEFISCQPFCFNGTEGAVIEQVAVRSGMDSKMAELLSFKHNIGISAMVIENKVKTLTITTFHSTSDIEDAFSSMNILNYTSVSSDYFPASAGSSSFNSSENSTDNIIPPVFSSFYNNTYLKDVQAFYAKESPISSLDPITPPAILTLSPILPPSLLFNPRYFFVPEELLPPKKQIYSSSSSSTTLLNSSRNQTCDLVSPSSLVYTPTPPQIFEIGKCSDKMYLKHHEKQVEDILNYLDELYLHRIKRMEEGRINGNELKTELKEIRIQIVKLQKKR
ncbi:hypothetical protein Tco_0957792, partial [Tanacetum coccineum]